MGWLLLVLGLSLAARGVVAAYTAYGLVATTLVLAALPALSFVLLLTPTGSRPSARWRWWAWVTGTAPVVLLAALVAARGSLDPRYQAENSPWISGSVLGGRIRKSARGADRSLTAVETSNAVIAARHMPHRDDHRFRNVL